MADEMLKQCLDCKLFHRMNFLIRAEMTSDSDNYDLVFASSLLKFLRTLLMKSSREKHMIKIKRAQEDAITLLV